MNPEGVSVNVFHPLNLRKIYSLHLNDVIVPLDEMEYLVDKTHLPLLSKQGWILLSRCIQDGSVTIRSNLKETNEQCLTLLSDIHSHLWEGTTISIYEVNSYWRSLFSIFKFEHLGSFIETLQIHCTSQYKVDYTYASDLAEFYSTKDDIHKLASHFIENLYKRLDIDIDLKKAHPIKDDSNVPTKRDVFHLSNWLDMNLRVDCDSKKIIVVCEGWEVQVKSK